MGLAGPGAAAGPGNPDEDPPPTWRFRDADRPVKVVVLAGSIGAWPKQPYARRIEQMCASVEVKNLSKAGYGAWALKKRFRQQVLKNPRVDLGNSDYEYWLVFHGGLNSVGTPERTNRHIRDLFLMAHQRGLGVVALSLTPWGDDKDGRWRGPSGLEYLRHTRTVVDFVVGRASPREALGVHVARRADPDAAWDPSELADVGIDLHDSALRDLDAAPRDIDVVRGQLARDRNWQKRSAALTVEERERALEHDARLAAEIPQWYLRKDLRSFDHIHPNEEGHRLIAETACPRLPASWNCECPPASPASSPAAEPGPDPSQPD